MAWPRLLVLVRHGESKGNLLSADERAQCSIPTHGYPLTLRGQQQAIITGGYLRQRFGDLIYITPHIISALKKQWG